MRQLLLTLVAGTSFFFIFSLALAQEALPFVPTPAPTPVNYSLPYPGILPDHPLYFFKYLRDRILLLLITNPLRQVEFHILLADKHLNMSLFLLDKQKPVLAIETLSKGIGYLEKGEDLLFKLPDSQTSETANLKDRFVKSLTKHLEVLETLKQNLSNTDKSKITELETKLRFLSDEFSRQN